MRVPLSRLASLLAVAPLMAMAILSLVAAGARAADGDFVAVPQLHTHVTDLTGTLSDSDKGALERKLAEWEAKRGAQFALLMVPTTKPDAIEVYSQRVRKLEIQAVRMGLLTQHQLQSARELQIH